MSDTISDWRSILFAPSLPGWGRLAHRTDGLIYFTLPLTAPFSSLQKSRSWWPGGGGLLLPHFPLQNAAPLQLHTPGMSCCSPLPKDTDPFVGRGEIFWVELQAGEQVRR